MAARGRFVVAVSGGHTPWQMLRALASEEVPWKGVHVVQVDERVAPAGDPDRNLTHLRESLLEHAPLRPEQIHAMPVEAPDLEAAAKRYALTLQDDRRLAAGARSRPSGPRPGRPHRLAGARRSGARRHRCRRRADRGVSGRRRMTLTYPMLNRSRRILWVVTGSEKVECSRACATAIGRFRPAGLRQDQALVLADRAAAGK